MKVVEMDEMPEVPRNGMHRAEENIMTEFQDDRKKWSKGMIGRESFLSEK